MEIKKIFLASAEHMAETDSQKNDFVDVVVYLKNGGKFIGCFLNYDSVEKLRLRNKATNQFLGGTYFFLNNLILIDDCSKDSITNVVNHLLDEGDFKSVFKQISA